MITIENKTAVRLDGQWVGNVPAAKWQNALVAMGATGGFYLTGDTYTATPMPRYRQNLVRTLKRIAA